MWWVYYGGDHPGCALIDERELGNADDGLKLFLSAQYTSMRFSP